MVARHATGLPVDLPDWTQFQNNDDLRAVGLSQRQIKMIWKRQGDIPTEVPKRDGTVRLCMGPNPSQKMLSMSLYVYLLRRHDEGADLWSDIAYGFVPGHSNLDAARAVECWLAKQEDVCFAYSDLRGAFGAVDVHGVRRALRSAGLTGWNLELAVRLLTRPDEFGRQVLTTGNPTSPLILNAACRELDDRLAKVVRGRGGIAVRYADDICVGAVGTKSRSLRAQLLGAIREAGFTPHPKKQGCTSSSQKPSSWRYVAVEVVGVIVERSAYRKRPDGAYSTHRMTSKRSFRDLIRAMEHRGSDATDPRYMGRTQYASACRTWDREKPIWNVEEAVLQVEARHRDLLAMRERRRNSPDN